MRVFNEKKCKNESTEVLSIFDPIKRNQRRLNPRKSD